MHELTKVLMLSSSRQNDEPYLTHAKEMIKNHLNGVSEVLFIPYAGVTVSWDAYTAKVQEALPELSITGIHEHADAKLAIQNAQAVLVGGGNTFNLLNEIYKQDLLKPIQQRVYEGMPYIGWPIIQPQSFTTFGFINAQINPHYTDYVAPNHNGETRDQRLAEFCTLYPGVPVIGIREGGALLREGSKLTLIGELDGVVFIGTDRKLISTGSDISVYL
jgi:dipeptidase E